MKNIIYAGNWKMNMNKQSIIEYISNINCSTDSYDVVLAVPSCYLDFTHDLIKKQGKNILLFSQNVSEYDSGAYTGELSLDMLKEVGCQGCIIGHSERRQIFNESNQVINNKLKKLIKEKFNTILCIGEDLKTRENNKVKEFLYEQLKNSLKDINEKDAKDIVIAYEPIWAIGTGKTASPEDANNTIKHVRDILRELYSDETADNSVILYGGSVKPDNINDLMEKQEIDGVLVGGASLKAKDFNSIIGG